MIALASITGMGLLTWPKKGDQRRGAWGKRQTWLSGQWKDDEDLTPAQREEARRARASRSGRSRR